MTQTFERQDFNTAWLMRVLTNLKAGPAMTDILLDGKVIVLEYAGFDMFENRGDFVIPSEADPKDVELTSKFGNTRFCLIVKLNNSDKSKLDCYAVNPYTNELITKNPVSATEALSQFDFTIRFKAVDTEGRDFLFLKEEIKERAYKAYGDKFEQVVEFSPERWFSETVESALAKRAMNKKDILLPPKVNLPQFSSVEEVRHVATIASALIEACKAFGKLASNIMSAIQGRGRE